MNCDHCTCPDAPVTIRCTEGDDNVVRLCSRCAERQLEWLVRALPALARGAWYEGMVESGRALRRAAEARAVKG